MQGRIIGNIFLKIAVSIEQVYIDQNSGLKKRLGVIRSDILEK